MPHIIAQMRNVELNFYNLTKKKYIYNSIYSIKSESTLLGVLSYGYPMVLTANYPTLLTIHYSILTTQYSVIISRVYRILPHPIYTMYISRDFNSCFLLVGHLSVISRSSLGGTHHPNNKHSTKKTPPLGMSSGGSDMESIIIKDI